MESGDKEYPGIMIAAGASSGLMVSWKKYSGIYSKSIISM
jgi:hypothetical protein